VGACGTSEAAVSAHLESFEVTEILGRLTMCCKVWKTLASDEGLIGGIASWTRTVGELSHRRKSVHALPQRPD
jgi:hypothetical protein